MPILLLYSMSGFAIAAIVPVTKSMISIETISARAYKTDRPRSGLRFLKKFEKFDLHISPPLINAWHDHSNHALIKHIR